jgi:predicted lipoprotein with Yx(FWY)xxD motif
MRVTLSATVAAVALMTISGAALAKLSPTAVPLSMPAGVTFSQVRAPLPAGMTPDQVAMAEQLGGMSFSIDIYADASGRAFYTYDPAPKISTNSDIGSLVDNAAAKAILDKHFPGMTNNPAIGAAKAMTLRAVKQFIPGLTDEKLAALDAELATVPPAAGAAWCIDECATTWPPFLVVGNEPVGGPWSIVTRPDGKKQWALDGKAVHTYTKDEKPGEAKGNKADGNRWMQAARKPDAPIPMPNGFKIAETMNFDGKVLQTTDGKPVFYSDDDKKPNMSACNTACTRTWAPLAAPRLAVPVGEFTVADRLDGMKQWAFKGKPLYTYTGDTPPTAAVGKGAKWHEVTMVRYYFPNDIHVEDHPKFGPMLTTPTGMTLYARDAHRFTLAGGSHDDRVAMRGKPSTGVKIGVNGCVDECLKEFTPMKASANALPWGDWAVVTRPDGTKQWSYRGFPLYTYNADKKPGDAIAHDIYELTDGTTGLFWRVALP